MIAATNPNYTTTGNAVLKFRLVNVRQTYSFVLFTGSTSAPLAVAQSNPVTFADPNQPQNRRLTLTNNPTEVRTRSHKEQ